ncbi:MAG TPA: hypothetical protein VD884_09320 [Ohtaekwangia sp.]|nr:hypothetical protein [Ohtaekwangia sp.]
MVEVTQDSAVDIIQHHIQSATVCLVTFDILRWTMKPASLINQWTDSNGNIWFWFSAINAGQAVYAGANMEVFYSNSARSKFMSLVGYAFHPNEVDRNDQSHPAYASLNTSVVDTPFQLVKFIPSHALYWSDSIKDMVPLKLQKVQSS